MASTWRSSPHDYDPLSWLTGPSVAIVLGGLSVMYGAISVGLIPDNGSTHVPGWIATALFALATVLIARFARPGSSRLNGLRAAAPVGLGWVAVTLSGYGYAGRGLPLDFWWAPTSLALILVALAPYSSPLRIVVVGTLSCLVTLAIILLAFSDSSSSWPPVTRLVIGISSVALSTVAGATFAYQVVSRIKKWTSLRPGPALSSGVLGEAAKLRILQQELDSVGERALPLLRRVAATGQITDEDQHDAEKLARELRDELVGRANRSWLDALAPELNLSVVDPQRRAESMSAQQRTALFGMLRAGSEASSEPMPPHVIELRAESDGSTAVAVSMDVHLPEGRRVKLLAPHYLELSAIADDLTLDPGKKFKVRFRLPANPRRST